jgi:folylpolyglutamate synthase
MSQYVKSGDSVACVEFGKVDGMEWVKPIDAEQIKRVAEILTGHPENINAFGPDVKEGIKWAVKQTKEQQGMLVGTGSLYLVGEIHRLLRDDREFNGSDDDDDDDDDTL